MNFYVGQKIVCVDAAGTAPHMLPLKEGSVYTVRGFLRAAGETGCYLHELRNSLHPSCVGEVEWAYRPRRFRPAVERKTSIEIFKKMLVPSERQKETV